MRQITKPEKNVLFVLVLICPAIVGGAFSAKINGNLLNYAIAAIIGALLWRAWIFLRDRRARERQRNEAG